MSFSGMLITSQWRNSRLTGSALEGTSGSVKYKSADDYIHFNKRLDDAICTPYQSCIGCREPLDGLATRFLPVRFLLELVSVHFPREPTDYSHIESVKQK